MSLEKIKKLLNEENFKRIEAIDNPKLHRVLAEWLEHLNPSEVFVVTDEPGEIKKVREEAKKVKEFGAEEMELADRNHTVHYDSYYDQARDKPNTKILRPEGMQMGKNVNSIDRKKGLAEVYDFLKDSMKGRKLFVRLFSLAPAGSKATKLAFQLTDSAYVAHSEDLLYRTGYEEFKRQGSNADFYTFIHSQGELERGEHGLAVTKNIDKRRIYVDLAEKRVLTVNNQYAGNSLGLKKLALRLAIDDAVRSTIKHADSGAGEGEPWLAEHMFVMGVNSSPGLSSEKGRKTYFVGAYPSACGKTSTAMTKGNTIVGDDIAYFFIDEEGNPRAVNIESGVFGIIRDVNPKDDPVIQKSITDPKNEVIYSNVLIAEGKPYWLGMGMKEEEIPSEGINFSGKWTKGKNDPESGKEIPLAHPNARYTLRIEDLENADEALHEPEGVEIGGIIYGGRDADTNVPVKQSFDWEHGIITMGGSLESETTSATLGKAGVRKWSPMANGDFVSVPIGRYLRANLHYGSQLNKVPPIFQSNYFQKDSEGRWLTGMEEKRVWLKWMELRANGDVEAIEAPTGYIPIYEVLKTLFKEELGKDYSEEDYVKQFTIRIPEHIEKIKRVREIYMNEVLETPKQVFVVLDAQEKRLLDAKEKYGEDYISPLKLEG